MSVVPLMRKPPQFSGAMPPYKASWPKPQRHVLVGTQLLCRTPFPSPSLRYAFTEHSMNSSNKIILYESPTDSSTFKCMLLHTSFSRARGSPFNTNICSILCWGQFCYNMVELHSTAMYVYTIDMTVGQSWHILPPQQGWGTGTAWMLDGSPRSKKAEATCRFRWRAPTHAITYVRTYAYIVGMTVGQTWQIPALCSHHL